ncbi:MAG: CpcT/CpeT family chromophore lyase [Rhodospirillaceae bacterium]|nr:CpcT/CpeT family chromophore lyase [Rhodospirillaceae bacterium]
MFRQFVAAAMIVSCSADAAVSADATPDFARFVALWPGEYDNLSQVQAQAAAGVPEKERNPAMKLFIREVDLPAFGPLAYYAEWRAADGSDKVVRQRIYALQSDAARGALRLNLHIWPADNPAFVARTTGAHRDPARLAGVTPADMAGLAGCDVFFTADGDGFAGAMDRGACAFPAPDGTPIYSWSQMRIDAAAFAYLDGWFHPDGRPYMAFTKDWFRFDRRPAKQ